MYVCQLKNTEVYSERRHEAFQLQQQIWQINKSPRRMKKMRQTVWQTDRRRFVAVISTKCGYTQQRGL